MADHLITGTLTYVVIHCGNLSCGHVWEQPHTDIDDPGWNVCPECLWAAPTNVQRCRECGRNEGHDVWCETASAAPREEDQDSG